MTPPRSVFSWTCRDRQLRLGEATRIMGVLNVTPDSFSDGGSYSDPSVAIARGLQMEAEGADILDVGGESTRPGAAPVSVADELQRVVPVIKGLAQQSQALISIDTSKPEVAQAALDAGAHIINDVSGFRDFKGMVKAAASTRAGVVLMHMQGDPRTMQENPCYENTASEVIHYLKSRRAAVEEAGILPRQVVVDPGIGFGKNLQDNIALLQHIPRMVEEAGPVLIGLSRKRMLGEITGREVDERLAGSLAGLAWSVTQGAHIIRVHDVKESCDSAKIMDILGRMDGHHE